MRTYALITALSAASLFSINSATPPLYTINNIPLPESMNKQVCISGTKYLDGKLYFASERCPVIFEADPTTGVINKSITFNLPEMFEMEGLTSYKSNLYLVSENTVGIYEVNPADGKIRQLETSKPLPGKTKNGDGMEGIAANERDNKFYVLRERNEDMTASEIWTFSIDPGSDDNSFNLKFESVIELPLTNPQWRYSDICFDKENDRLLCLKSYSKGKLRQQFIEAIEIDKTGNLKNETLKDINVEKFSEISNQYKDLDYSMNLEGITVDQDGTIYIVSDNTSGKAQCDMPAKEKTILLKLVKK